MHCFFFSPDSMSQQPANDKQPVVHTWARIRPNQRPSQGYRSPGGPNHPPPRQNHPIATFAAITVQHYLLTMTSQMCFLAFRLF